VIPLPSGFRIAFDPTLRWNLGGRVLVGGTPPRVIRLTDAGREALLELTQIGTDSVPVRLLARHLVDAGMAHPIPPKSGGDFATTIVVPVRDRPEMLASCLAALHQCAPVIVVDDGSLDRALTASICERYGADLIRLDPGRGAAAARNAAVAAVSTELVAFVDSDCIPSDGWLLRMIPHFIDPLVGAVAPRVVPRERTTSGQALATFTAARSPLDMGQEQGLVGPGNRIPYVPTATLIARRSALNPPFDPALRYGEDVDLVWRLHDAGWHVRYVPQVVAEHEEPASWPDLLRRRYRYGTSVGPLARRHPRRLSHLVLRTWPTSSATLLLAGRPRGAIAIAAAHAVSLRWRLRKIGVPFPRAFGWATSGFMQTTEGIGHFATMFAAPVLLAAVAPRKRRQAALLLLFVAPLADWARRRPPVDPLRWVLACIADDIAYGAGVWRGCVDARTLAPLLPRRSEIR
jgi:mycofactocin glycosyltransferase